MDLKLASTDDLQADVPRLVELLGRNGVQVSVSAGGVSLGPLEQALADGDLDLVLAQGNAHGLLDRAEGTRLTVLRRDEPRDVVVPAPGRPGTLSELPPGSRVGLTGPRRRSFLRAHRPGLLPVSPWNGGGPDETLQSGAVDALVLGAGEARRLGLGDRVSEALDAKAWVPAPGQGCLVLLSRDGQAGPGVLAALDHVGEHRALEAELTAAEALGTRAEGAVGILGLPHGRWIRMWGMVASGDGRRVVRGDVTGRAASPEAAGRALADLLLARGAGSLLREAVT